MLFSVIVPVYNVENYLCECIDSIVTQIKKDDMDVEIILLDDGSTDGSGNICDTYSEKYPTVIKTYHKKNEGLLCTRRMGFDLAKGDYIINCDSDDILEKNALITLKKIIDEFSPDVLIYNMGTYNGVEKRPFYENCFTEKVYCKINKEQILNSYFTDDIPIVTTMAGKAIKKECIDLDRDYSLFAGNSFGEDTLQSAEIYERANNIIYINQVLYYYRISTGMTAKFTEVYYDNFLQIMKYISTYQYISTNDSYYSWVTIKMLKILARSITQSKNNNIMNYRNRKHYFEYLFRKEYVCTLLENLGKYKNKLSWKYRIILFMFKHKLFFCLHILLLI